MDPSQLQSDTDNDVHSLEQAGTVIESGAESAATANQGNVPQAGGAPAGFDSTPAAGAPPQPQRPSLLHRLWRKLNVYFLLFLLLLLIGIGMIVVFTLKTNKAAPVKTSGGNSQSLSQNTLQQLANSDVTVGTAKQTLNVASNAIFAGGVLIRSNLEVAGTVAIGGNLSLPGITVSGTSQLGQVNTSNLAVSGTANVQGLLTAKSGLNVSGASTFSGAISTTQITTGALQLNGTLDLTHHITAGGPSPTIAKGVAVGGGGSASLSGSDTSGSIVINTGNSPPAGCFATITFNAAFASIPHVVLTPIGASAAGLQYYVNRSATNMSICALNSAPASQTFGFDYMVLD